MEVHFWGTRGSLPASYPAHTVERKIRQIMRASLNSNIRSMGDVDSFLASLPHAMKASYGTNTSCVQIRDHGNSEILLLDAGSGLRDLAVDLAAQGTLAPHTFHIFMSHLHWDHIQGFPFFTPAYIPGNIINIYGLHDTVEMAFHYQQKTPVFPVPLSVMKSTINFITLDEGREYHIAGFNIRTIQQNHPGDSYGFRFQKDGKTIVYSTDCEHKKNASSDTYPFVEFFRDADVLIFDAQYDFLDAVEAKVDWGHSNNLLAVELAVRANVKNLCLYHNEHSFSDEQLEQHHQGSLQYLESYAPGHPLKIHLAYDSLRLAL